MPHKAKLNTVDAVVDDIIGELHQETRFQIVRLNEEQLELHEYIIGLFIQYRLDRMDETSKKVLMKDCLTKSGNGSMNEVDAAGVIMYELWEKLKEMHRLRVVK